MQKLHLKNIQGENYKTFQNFPFTFPKLSLNFTTTVKLKPYLEPMGFCSDTISHKHLNYSYRIFKIRLIQAFSITVPAGSEHWPFRKERHIEYVI